MTRARDVANIDGLLTAKGDIYAATAAATPARLGVGANGTVLTANSATSTGLAWTAVNANSLTSLATGTFSGSNLALTSIDQTYEHLQLVIRSVRATSTNEFLRLRINNDTTNGNYRTQKNLGALTSTSAIGLTPDAIFQGTTVALIVVNIYDYVNTTTHKTVTSFAYYQDGSTTYQYQLNQGFLLSTATVSRLDLFFDSGNSFAGGTYELFGVK